MKRTKKIKKVSENYDPFRYPHRNPSHRKDVTNMQKYFRNPWTPEEDVKVQELIKVYSTNWSLI